MIINCLIRSLAVVLSQLAKVLHYWSFCEVSPTGVVVLKLVYIWGVNEGINWGKYWCILGWRFFSLYVCCRMFACTLYGS